MNRTNKQRLEKLHFDSLKEKYPNTPAAYFPKIKTNENSANTLTQLVKSWLEFNGWQAERINTTGRMIDTTDTFEDVIGRRRSIGSKQWVKGTSTPGSADISATIRGKSVKIEIKWGKDRQSEVQKKYEENITNAGGVYLIVRSFDEFVQWYDDFMGINYNEAKEQLEKAIISYFYNNKENSTETISKYFNLRLNYVNGVIDKELQKKKK